MVKSTEYQAYQTLDSNKLFSRHQKMQSDGNCEDLLKKKEANDARSQKSSEKNVNKFLFFPQTGSRG